jgi:hypothetical protein
VKLLFSIRQRGIFCPGQKIKWLCGGVHRYAAQATPRIDTARAEKNRFRMKTKKNFRSAAETLIDKKTFNLYHGEKRLPLEETEWREH